MKKENADVRKKIIINGLKYWQVAKEIGISPSTFTIWLREPLSDEKKEVVVKAINKAAKESEVV